MNKSSLKLKVEDNMMRAKFSFLMASISSIIVLVTGIVALCAFILAVCLLSSNIVYTKANINQYIIVSLETMVIWILAVIGIAFAAIGATIYIHPKQSMKELREIKSWVIR